MADVTHADPLVTESKLTEFYNDIKPFLGCPAYVTQEGDAEYYSTDEKVIGRWLDDKPLYQKTIVSTIPTANSSNVKQVESTNGLKIYGLQASIVTPGGATFPVEYIDLGTTVGTLVWNRDVASGANYIAIKNTNSNRNGDTVYITIRYTKDSDSASTTIEQKPTHYSTDEQVVGVWTNNKPIYQKTFSTTAPNAPSNGSYGYKTFAHGIQNLDEYVEISGVITSNEFSSMLPFFTDSGYKTKFNINATEISIANDAAYANGRKVSITVKYTKSTD